MHKHSTLNKSFVERMNSSNAYGMFFTELCYSMVFGFQRIFKYISEDMEVLNAARWSRIRGNNTSFLRFLHTDFKTCFIMENFKYTPKERE